MEQMELAARIHLVKSDHVYRRFLAIWNFDEAAKYLEKMKANNP